MSACPLCGSGIDRMAGQTWCAASPGTCVIAGHCMPVAAWSALSALGEKARAAQDEAKQTKDRYSAFIVQSAAREEELRADIRQLGVVLDGVGQCELDVGHAGLHVNCGDAWPGPHGGGVPSTYGEFKAHNKALKRLGKSLAALSGGGK
jgi:hypothetical protein